MKEYRICEVCEHPNDISFLECTTCSADLSHVYPTTIPEELPKPKDVKQEEIVPLQQSANLSSSNTMRMNQLKLIHDTSGRTLKIRVQGGLIGREGDVDCDFFAAFPYVSNQHARIHLAEQEYLLVDENSMNGTFVNGQQLHPNQSHALKNGDKVVIANVALTVQL